MNDFYLIALVLVALAVLVNRGNRSKVHYAVQLFCTSLVLFGALALYNRL